MLTVNEIKETYKVDVGTGHTTYERTDTGTDYERARVELADRRLGWPGRQRFYRRFR